MIHVMLGPCFGKTICDVLEYVLKYGDQELSGFFTGMTCTEETDGSLVFRQAEKSAAQDRNNALYFNSDIDDEYRASLSPEKTVIRAEKQMDYLKAFFVHLFDSRITINTESDDNTLNVCLYLPLYDEKAWLLAKKLMAAVSQQRRNIKVDLFFFAYDLAHLLVDESELATLPEKLPGMQKLSCRILKEAVGFKAGDTSASCLRHLIVMQNCNSDGVSLDLNRDSLVRIIGEFCVAAVNSYDDIFSLRTDAGRPITAMGLSVLNLDKYYFVRYLLSKAYVKILEREGIDTDFVDVSSPSLVVQDILSEDDCYRFYDRFYDAKVRELISQQLDEQTINTRASVALDEEVQRFVSRILSFVNREDMSLSEKRVTLAMLLGMDDDLMTGDSPNPNQLIFRDTYSDCMNMFVEANNRLLEKGPSDLFVPIPDVSGYVNMGVDSEGKDVQYPEELSLSSYAVLSSRTIDYKALQKSLKDTEVEIRRWTEYIRMRQNELEACDTQIKQGDEKNKVLVDGGFKYGNVVYRPVVVENIPLELTYEPKVTTLPKSLDLRRNFPAIKNQGPVGACTCFAIAGVYEYILGMRGNRETLSEKYLYYNARVYANRRLGVPDENIVDAGSSYYDAFKSLGEVGISTNVLCPYGNGENPNERPSDAAYEDGKTRLVTEARNVRIQEKDIKSALNEGYPVMFSAKLFDSFASTSSGFVPMPSEDEIRNEKTLEVHSSHAMVICGYSDKDKVFIVRNSWGTSFGDGGYCYMPYSYVLNPELVTEASIITGINSEAVDTPVKANQPTVEFDRMNPAINAAIIKNLLSEAVIIKDKFVKVRNSLYSQCKQLEQVAVNASVRTSLFEGTRLRLEWEQDKIREQMRKNDNCESNRLEVLDSAFKVTSVIYGISLLVILLVFIFWGRSALFRLILFILPLSKVLLGLVALSIAAYVFYVFEYRKQRRNLQDEHQEVRRQLSEMRRTRESGSGSGGGRLGLYLDNLSVRMFIPWKVVIKLTEQERYLEQKYQTLISFVNNLKEWHDRELRKVREMSPDTREPFISLLSNKTLDAYFEDNAERLTRDVRLYSLFGGGYEIKEEAIVQFQNKLKSTIVTALMGDLGEFTVYRYLTGKTTFQFLGERKYDADEMLQNLARKSKVFLNLADEVSNFITESSKSRVMLSQDIREDQDNWDARFRKNFAERFTHIPIASPFKITYMQVAQVPLSLCLDLYEPEQEVPGSPVREETETKGEPKVE